MSYLHVALDVGGCVWGHSMNVSSTEDDSSAQLNCGRVQAKNASCAAARRQHRMVDPELASTNIVIRSVRPAIVGRKPPPLVQPRTVRQKGTVKNLPHPKQAGLCTFPSSCRFSGKVRGAFLATSLLVNPPYARIFWWQLAIGAKDAQSWKTAGYGARLRQPSRPFMDQPLSCTAFDERMRNCLKW